MPFDGFHPLNLIVILVIALLIFGPKKLPEMGKAIGQSIQMFRKGMSELTNPKEEDVPEETYLPAKTPEALRQELEELEREIANRKATLAAQEIITPEAPVYHPEITEDSPVSSSETTEDSQEAPLYEANASTNAIHPIPEPEVTNEVHTPSETTAARTEVSPVEHSEVQGR